MHVLMVTPRFAPSTGGVETHVAEVAPRLARLGHQVTVLTTDPSRRLPAVDRIGEIRVLRGQAWPRHRDWLFAPGLPAAIRGGVWDVIHLQSYHTLVAPLALATARRRRIPYVVTFHGGGHSSAARNRIRSFQLRSLRPLLRGASSLVLLAQFEFGLYQRPLDLAAERFVVIPNGAELPEPPAGLLHASERPPLVASIGRLERYKGHQYVIRAFPHVLHERPDARLWIAGHGPYEQRLRSLIKKLGIESAVEIRAVPPDQRATMASRLANTAVVVLASAFETHPLAALEAASLGCPLIVADTSGLRELADRGLAHLVAARPDPDVLGRAILTQLATPEVPPHVELSSWDDCAASLCVLYESVVHAG